ncbi:hypothetical protein B0H14DRAFT_2714436 [Mycena olivaceomarginata]|nr:hypothetical protein B0H14DRAFT_2714436 [Mycena olivaceomarginata]
MCLSSSGRSSHALHRVNPLLVSVLFPIISALLSPLRFCCTRTLLTPHSLHHNPLSSSKRSVPIFDNLTRH